MNEYTIINDELQTKANKYHRNIIAIYESFIDKPSDAFFDHFPDDLKEFVTHLNGKRRSCQVVVMPHYSFNLQQYFKEEKRYISLSLFDKLLICYQLANALKFLFSNHIMHRDLKLNNILVSSPHSSPHHYHHHNEGIQVVICDFGCAVKVDANYKLKLAAGELVIRVISHLKFTLSLHRWWWWWIAVIRIFLKLIIRNKRVASLDYFVSKSCLAIIIPIIIIIKTRAVSNMHHWSMKFRKEKLIANYNLDGNKWVVAEVVVAIMMIKHHLHNELYNTIIMMIQSPS